jgi:dihydropyrimidinase
MRNPLLTSIISINNTRSDTVLMNIRITKRLISRGHTLPKFHATSRPQIAEAEATNRAISLATLTSTPILLVHMSSRVALHHARKAQSRLLPIHAETCPHYLYLLSSKLAETAPEDEGCGHWEGAKYVCAPPLRHSEDDLQYVWDELNNGTLNVISSDHAATKYHHENGKQKPLRQAEASGGTPVFNQIPNGLPGLETRLPLLFHAATSLEVDKRRRLPLPKFVALTSTNPAKIYGLDGVKGSIAPGYDADLCIWYPEGDARGITTITNDKLHHDIDYTPFEGMRVGNWPRWVILRGKVRWDRDGGGLLGKPGDGKFLKRGKGKVSVGRTEVEVVGMRHGERGFWMDGLDE